MSERINKQCRCTMNRGQIEFPCDLHRQWRDAEVKEYRDAAVAESELWASMNPLIEMSGEIRCFFCQGDRSHTLECIWLQHQAIKA